MKLNEATTREEKEEKEEEAEAENKQANGKTCSAIELPIPVDKVNTNSFCIQMTIEQIVKPNETVAFSPCLHTKLFS